ncbi:MICOS complex subunit Mic60-like [Bicyclus anynana]|uniref:MICOS complex subunit MIC60 n=1 Tax=Bicyclus anynana TaxID=110368 RepID=A0ABM3M0K7_BICAN|nr:MICOS complex subunit Mic60-like [Bicyclus anynana]
MWSALPAFQFFPSPSICLSSNQENRHRLSQVQSASVPRYEGRRYETKVRDTCPPPPPPPPPAPKDDSTFWGAMAVLFTAAGFAVIAKGSPEIRDWLTIYAPWFDDLIAVIFEENYTHKELAQRYWEQIKSCAKIVMKDETCPPEGAKPEKVPAKDEIEAGKAASEPEEADESCVKPPPVVVRKTICEILERLKERKTEALSNYYTAHHACLLYNKIVPETMKDFSIKSLKALHGQLEERVNLVNEAIKNAEEATADIEELERYIECGVQGPKDEVENIKVLMNDFLLQIKAANIQFIWEYDTSKALDAQWLKVECTLYKYIDENRAMFPEIDYEQFKLQLRGDPDLLLHHAGRYVRQLTAELSDAVEGMKERANRAYEMLPQGDKERKDRDYMLQSLLKQKRAEMDKEFQNRYAAQRQENDKTAQDALKKQLERHQATLEKRLIEKENEVRKRTHFRGPGFEYRPLFQNSRTIVYYIVINYLRTCLAGHYPSVKMKLNKLVNERVAYEKHQFAIQLKEMAAKLALVQDKLNTRLKIERETRRSQDLWVAGASLLAATKKGDPYVNVEKELKAIERASGDGDELVTMVLQAIPQSVRERGLVPESVLMTNYHRMEDVALKVALVEQDGASFPIYMMSWLQSAFLFMKLSGIPQTEIDSSTKDAIPELDTFDLLQRARFWVERGNLARAIRYVSSLEGASRAASMTWHDAARAHVETRQAAEAILAHAAALGLQYI